MQALGPSRRADCQGPPRRRVPRDRCDGGEQVHLHAEQREAGVQTVQLLRARLPCWNPPNRRQRAMQPRWRKLHRQRCQVLLLVDRTDQLRACVVHHRQLRVYDGLMPLYGHQKPDYVAKL